MARSELPRDLIRIGWQWHPTIETALVRETKAGREVKDAGSAEASIQSALRTVPKRGRPPKKRTPATS